MKRQIVLVIDIINIYACFTLSLAYTAACTISSTLAMKAQHLLPHLLLHVLKVGRFIVLKVGLDWLASDGFVALVMERGHVRVLERLLNGDSALRVEHKHFA